MLIHNRSQLKKGFTLIETLVAISILLLSIVGPLEIASKGLFSAFYARDEISAYYLAQEGLEFVRNLRDTNYIQSISDPDILWLDELDGSCFSTDGCAINPVYVVTGGDFGGAVIGCTPDCPRLNYEETSAILSINTSNPESKFTRKVKVTLDGSNTSALVESTVYWEVGTLFASTKSFVLRERIFNWNQ